jgi:hypothetical protein
MVLIRKRNSVGVPVLPHIFKKFTSPNKNGASL